MALSPAGRRFRGLLAARFAGEAFVDVFENVRGLNIQSITEAIDHAQAGTAFPEFDQRDVIAIDGSTQSQICLAPFALGAQAAKCLAECLIYVQLGAQ